jgi:hypothetical protein
VLNYADMSFSEDARQVFELAKDHADRLGQDHFGVEHILLGVLDLPRGGAKTALDSQKVYRVLARSRLEGMAPVGRAPGNRGELPYTPAGVALLKSAMEDARSAGGTIVNNTWWLACFRMLIKFRMRERQPVNTNSPWVMPGTS